MVSQSHSQSLSKVKLSKWQSQVWLDKNRYKVINCGRRAGKTFLTAAYMIDFTNKKNSEVWYIAPTYRQAKLIMWQMLRNFVPEWTIKQRNKTELTIDLINGSRISLKGADNPDSLRGVRIDLCMFDECAFIERWDEVWKVIRPTLMDSKADVWFISTPNGFNHFKDLSEKWAYHHYTTYDNPYIDRAEIDQAKTEMDEDSFAQEMLGEFRKMSGLIYKMFDRKTHMVDIPDIKGWTHSRTLDFGFVHKTALIYFAVNSTGTEMYGYDGLYESGLVMQDIADAVKIKDTGKSIYNGKADAAQPAFLEELSRLGVHFDAVEKGPDSVKNGITKVAELLKIRNDTGKPTLMFNKDLDWIADEFEQYRWMENKVQDVIKEVPLKRNDDAMDAIRYFAVSYIKEDTDFKLPDDASKFRSGWY